MASPFRIFRKYQKTLLVVAGVILMFVFVVGDSLMQYVGQTASGGGGVDASRHPGAVAVRWDGGKLSNAELDQLVMQRLVVNGFVGAVVSDGQRAAVDAGIQPPPLRVEMLAGPERPQEGVERDVVRVRIFADAARAAGMDVSDEHVVQYLSELGRGLVSIERIREILSRLNFGGRRASVDFVLDAVREELLARNYLASYTFAFDTVLPEERWKDWLRVNDRVVVEAAAIPVESFLVDVPEPSETELAEFFDRWKDREPMPDRIGDMELPSPNPGFAVPRRVELQYLRADFDQFLANVEEEITEEEIEKFYEDNKDPYFIKVDTGLLDSEGKQVDASEVQPADDTDEPSTDGQSEAEPTDDSMPVDEATDDGAPEPGNQSSLFRPKRRGVFRLAAYAAEQTDDETDDDPLEPAAETTDSAAGDLSESTERPMEFQPLDDVRDEIRKNLAQFKVSEQLGAVMGQLETELSTSYARYFSAVLDADAAGDEPPPPPAELADLTPLAEKHGFEYVKTEPISFLQLRDLPIGMSATSEGNAPPFVAYVFSREVELYQPVTTFDLDNNRYLALKLSDTPGRVPKLEEIRDAVARAWKLQRAAEVALKRAQEHASQAKAAGASLDDYFADQPGVAVTKTDPFAWLTVGSISRQTQQVQSFRLSEPDGILAADNEVMRTIFGLGDGEVGAVLNHDHTYAYVVRIVEHEDTPDELRQQFLAEADNWYGLPTMSRDHAQFAVRVLLTDMLESSGIKWERPPDEIFRGEDG